MNKEIPVFFAVDNGYIPFLGVALSSLIENTSKENKYAIKVLYTSVTEENKARIKKYEKENISIEFVDLNKQLEDIKEKLYTRNYFSNTTYYRLFIESNKQKLEDALKLKETLKEEVDVKHTNVSSWTEVYEKEFTMEQFRRRIKEEIFHFIRWRMDFGCGIVF